MRDKELRNAKGQNEQEFLEAYKPGNYERPSVTVDILIFSLIDKKTETKRTVSQKELRVLLIKRKDHPFMHCWAIPGGFVNMDENLDTAAYRELKEETNVEDVYLEQLYTFGNVGRDPRMRVISTAYLALTSQEDIEPVAGDDAKEAKWFIVQNGEQYLKLVSEDGNDVICYDKTTKKDSLKDGSALAFDHFDILLMGLERLKNKVDYTDVAFSLLPELFTMTEARNVYENLLGKQIDKANFRREIKKKVIETDQYADDYKKSRLYRFNPCWNNKKEGK